jgi:hypothetical protein
VLEGHGREVLYPAWERVRGDLADLAARSEAPADVVAAQLGELAADAPSAARLSDLIQRT